MAPAGTILGNWASFTQQQQRRNMRNTRGKSPIALRPFFVGTRIRLAGRFIPYTPSFPDYSRCVWKLSREWGCLPGLASSFDMRWWLPWRDFFLSYLGIFFSSSSSWLRVTNVGVIDLVVAAAVQRGNTQHACQTTLGRFYFYFLSWARCMSRVTSWKGVVKSHDGCFPARPSFLRTNFHVKLALAPHYAASWNFVKFKGTICPWNRFVLHTRLRFL